MLAIYAVAPASDAKAATALEEVTKTQQTAQIKAFQAGVPAAKVVSVQNAQHHVFLSNEADGLKLMQDFLATLPDGDRK